MTGNLKTWPENMFFQWSDDDSLDLPAYHHIGEYEGITCCSEKINEGDVEYVRADVAKKRQDQILAIFCKLADQLSCENALEEIDKLGILE